MRVVGYVRERPPAVGAEAAFAQTERIRRWVEDNGHELVAVCRDPAAHEDTVGAGFDAMLAIVDAGVTDTVAIASPWAVGDTPTTQEIVMWDVARHGARLVVTTEDSAEDATDATLTLRHTVRDVLARLGAHEDRAGSPPRGSP